MIGLDTIALTYLLSRGQGERVAAQQVQGRERRQPRRARRQHHERAEGSGQRRVARRIAIGFSRERSTVGRGLLRVPGLRLCSRDSVTTRASACR